MMTYWTKALFACLIVISFDAQAQKKATFFADTIYQRGDWRNDPYTGFMKWTIQSKSFGWGEIVEVEVTKNQIDTLFFQRSPEEDQDTIICDLREARDYSFYINECCGGFNVLSNDKKGINSYISFEVKKELKDSTVVGTIGDTGGYIVGTKTESITRLCNSAMASNITPVKLGTVANCSEIKDCQGWMCNYTTHDVDSYSGDIGFSKLYFNFLYMPLNSTALKVYYNIEDDRLEFR